MIKHLQKIGNSRGIVLNDRKLLSVNGRTIARGIV